MEERKRIQQIYREVEKRLGLKPLNIEILTGQEHGESTGPCTCGHCHEQCSDSDRPNMGITRNKHYPDLYRLVYSPGITKHFDTFMLSGVIAHELGHVVLGHVAAEPNPQNEHDADAYAARKGFGEALQRVMEWNASQNWEMSWYASDSHPAVQERIWRLSNLNSEKRAA